MATRGIRGVDRAELIVCALSGHQTFAPDDAALAQRLRTETAVGAAWRCLRCATFVVGEPAAHGSVEDTPVILRGKALRQTVIVRLLGVERLIRAVAVGIAAWAVWKFRGERGAIQAALERDLPVFRAAGFKVDQMTIFRELEKALAQTPSTLAMITSLLILYALLELLEGVGLWLLQRWGEYFSVIATSAFLPLEIHDLLEGITMTRAVAFAINIVAVAYLLFSKRLFGLRGGRRAYDDERRGEQLTDVEQAAVAG